MYIHNKYFNWLALNMIQRFNTRARVLRRTRDGNSFEQYHFQLLATGVLDPILVECSDSVHSFGLWLRALATILLQYDRSVTSKM